MIRLTSATHISTANPSQWQGFDERGRMVYARYRHGQLSITRALSPGPDWQGAVNGRQLFLGQYDALESSYLSTKELRELTAGVIEWPEKMA